MKVFLALLSLAGSWAILSSSLSKAEERPKPVAAADPAPRCCPCKSDGSANVTADFLANSCLCAMYPFYVDPVDPNNVLYYCEITEPSKSCDVIDVAYMWSTPVFAPLYCDLDGVNTQCPACRDFSFIPKALAKFEGMHHKQSASARAAEILPFNVKHPTGTVPPANGDTVSHPHLGVTGGLSYIVSYDIPDPHKTVYIKLYKIVVAPSRTNFPRRPDVRYPENGFEHRIHIGFEINPDLNGDYRVDSAERAVLNAECIDVPCVAQRGIGDSDKSGENTERVCDSEFVRVVDYKGDKYIVALSKPLAP